jgi:hypothetical protein
MDTIHMELMGIAALMRKRFKSGGQSLAFVVTSILACTTAAAQSQQTSADSSQMVQPDTTQPTPLAQPTQTILPRAAQSLQMSGQPAHVFNYGVDAGVTEADNVTLVENNKVSQTIALVDVDFELKQQTRLLEAFAKGDFSYLDYLQNAYGSQFLGRFDGSLRAALIPEKLTWFFQDDFGQAALDPFQPVTPSNLENVNYFSTGPDLTLNLGPTGFFDLSARYARVQFQTSPYNSNRVQGSIAIGEQLSAISAVSLNVDSERVLFANTALNEDYDRTNAFVRYALKGSRTELSIDLGATEVVNSAESTTGGLARASLSRRLSQSAIVTLTAGHVLTDAGSAFSSLQGGAIGIVGNAPAPQTAATYTDNYVAADWEYVRGRTKVGLSGRYERDSYGGEETLDNSRGGGEFSVTRQLSRAFEAQLLGRLYKTNYTHLTPMLVVAGSPDYYDQLIAASLAWRLGRGFEVRLRAEHDARVTTGNDTGYKDNRGTLTIGYRPRPTTTQMGDPAGF